MIWGEEEEVARERSEHGEAMTGKRAVHWGKSKEEKE